MSKTPAKTAIKGDYTHVLMDEAIEYARILGHKQVEPAHLLVNLINDHSALEFFDNIELDMDKLEEYIDETELHLDVRTKVIHVDGALRTGNNAQKIFISEDAQKVSSTANSLAKAFHKENTSPAEMLLALYLEGDFITKKTLQEHSGLTKEELQLALVHPEANWDPNPEYVKAPELKKMFSKADRETIRNLADTIKSKVFNQDAAIDALHSSMKIAAAGLSADNKPLGTYLFAGPTGVGKTEVAEQLAKAKGVELIRIDMGEYSQEHNVNRLFGGAPGLIGYGDTGILQRLIESPDAVVLLDEIEKAHPKVFEALLQVMDNGKLTQNDNKVIDFTRSTIIMTSNAGATVASKPHIGFASAADQNKTIQSDYDTEIKKTFSPEFRNRLDGTIVFETLSKETIHKVATKMIDELNDLAGPRTMDLTITATNEAITALTNKSYDPEMNARPVQRAVDTYAKKPLAELILEGIENNMLIELEFDSNTDAFNLAARPKPAHELKSKNKQAAKASGDVLPERTAEQIKLSTNDNTLQDDYSDKPDAQDLSL